MSTTAAIAIASALLIGLVAVACALAYCGDEIARAIYSERDADDQD